MADHHTHAEVEQRVRQLLTDADIDLPDEVVYDPRSVVLLWHDRKVAVIVDLDDPAPDVEGLGVIDASAAGEMPTAA